MIKLDLRTDIHTMIAAFEAKQIQCYFTDNRLEPCSYASPCIVGTVIPVDMRHDLDDHQGNNSGVRYLIRDGVIEIPSDQVEDIINIQEVHDEVVQGFNTIDFFEQEFDLLCIKYK